MLLCLICGCSGNTFKSNEDYISYLSSIIVNYQKKHGKTPESFDIAFEESGITLPNRGDINGGSLAYYRMGDNAFMFRATGKNSKDDLGRGDDTDVYYVNQTKVSRDTFIKFVQTDNDRALWQVYHSLF